MTFNVGDRVRVTIEGTITEGERDHDGEWDIEVDREAGVFQSSVYFNPDHPAVTFEKVAPAAVVYPVGTVVRSKGSKCYYTVTERGLFSHQFAVDNYTGLRPTSENFEAVANV